MEKGWQFWQEMQECRGMQPNDIVLGCMRDALVCNSKIEETVQLLQDRKSRGPLNTVMFSTIVKGFANSRQGERVTSTWREMRRVGITRMLCFIMW